MIRQRQQAATALQRDILAGINETRIERCAAEIGQRIEAMHD